MRIAGETVGSRGVTLLSVAAIVGIILGVHGWRAHGVIPGLNPVAAGTPAATATAPASASAQPVQSSSSAAATQGPTAAATPKPGPRLSAQSYASYSFQVWPGPVSQAAQAALTGLTVKVTRQGSGILVQAGVVGQPAQAPVFYPTGAKVWVIEASMGDESGNIDSNLGDDGLVVTDSQGRILR